MSPNPIPLNPIPFIPSVYQVYTIWSRRHIMYIHLCICKFTHIYSCTYAYVFILGLYNLVPKAWLKAWRGFTRDPGVPTPPVLDCSSMLCQGIYMFVCIYEKVWKCAHVYMLVIVYAYLYKCKYLWIWMYIYMYLFKCMLSIHIHPWPGGTVPSGVGLLEYAMSRWGRKVYIKMNKYINNV
jgi:hypothetical protein